MKKLLITSILILIFVSSTVFAMELEVERCYTRGDYTKIEGSVHNDSDQTVYFLKVRLKWLKNGDVVDTGMTYAVGSERLRPGERSGFRGSSRRTDIDSCSASILDYKTP